VKLYFLNLGITSWSLCTEASNDLSKRVKLHW